jgi:tetratricopeptide (TPR) repeat protein
MLRSLLAIGFFAAFPLFVTAQPTTKRPADINRPKLMVQDGQTSTPLTLAKADLHVVITGFLAETTMTLTFHNDASRVMEGELVFPLPEGAIVSGYGLDVNGQIVDGVPVEKQKARITFETEVRKGVDPGIVEHVVGNNYRTRVYPIPARGDRTVKIQYLSELIQDKSGVLYTLPMNWGDQPVGEYHLKVELVNARGEPLLSGAAAGGLALKKAEDRTITEKGYQNARFSDDLVISLPTAPAQHVVVEKFNPEIIGRPEYYFVINDLPLVPAIERAALQPKRIGILWDASLSRADADKTRELALLKQILGRYKGVDVDVVVFRNQVQRPVELNTDKLEDLLRLLESVKYDGGTDLAELVIAKNPTELPFEHVWKDLPPNYDFWLMFTDGLGNLMGDMPKKVEAPVYLFSNDSRANHALLNYLATISGGQYFNLKRDANEQILPNIGYGAFSLLSVDFKGDEIADVYPHGVQPVRGRMAIAGKLRAPEAQVTLNYGIGTQVMQRQIYTLRQTGASETGQTARFWAQQKLAELAVFPERNHDELLRTGREFGIVTPNTSLMVLERVEQYLAYQITPPRSRPDIYAAYTARIEQQQALQKKSEQQKLEAVVKMWDQRAQWWEKQYPYAKDFRYAATANATGATTQPMSRLAGGAMGGFGGRGGGGARGAPPVAMRETLAMPALQAADKAAVSGEDASALSITIKPWDPQTPYLTAIKNARPADAYNVYLEQRRQYGTSPSFYLDCADFFLSTKQRETGLRVLTNIAELELESVPLLRIVAHRLTQIGELDLAIDLFEKILAMRPEEPQSFRDLALVLAERAELGMKEAGPLSERVSLDLIRSMDCLNKVVLGTWDGRFPEIEVIALMEFNRLIAKIRSDQRTRDLPIKLDQRLIKLLDLDVRISLTWDADATDIDLWVTEPSGEKCYYEHTLTTIGGAISKDFTQGYGPEEYSLRRAMAGQYAIQANFFGSGQQKLTGPTTIQATIFTDYGRPTEKRQSSTLRLVDQKETIDVGGITVGGK